MGLWRHTPSPTIVPSHGQLEVGLRVFISADMEGVSGVVHASQTTGGGPEYERAQKLMTGEANAAIEGALEAGCEEVVVADSHGDMRNILLEDLNPQAQLVMGRPRPLAMVEGVAGCQLALFVGYHAMMGTRDAVLDHTWHGRVVARVAVNGEPMSETALNAALAGEAGVPVGLVTGDLNTIEQTGRWLPKAECVVVKWGIGRNAARCLHPSRARALIREASARAVRRSAELPLFRLGPPLSVELEFVQSAMADLAELVPTVCRTDARSVQFEPGNIVEGFKVFRALVLLAITTLPGR